MANYLISDGSRDKRLIPIYALSYKLLSWVFLSYLEREIEDRGPATPIIRRHEKCI